MPKLYLTDTFVAQVRCPEHKDQEIFWDSPKTLDGRIRNGAVVGLGIRVTSHGMKTFVHSYLFNGKRRRFALGSSTNMNVSAVRLKVMLRDNKIHNGEDPDVEIAKDAFSSRRTVGELLELYWKEHFPPKSVQHQYKFCRYVAPWLKKQPALKTRRGCNQNYFDVPFGQMYRDRAIESIKPIDVKSCLAQYQTHSTYNAALTLLRSFFHWLIKMELVDMRNPCNPFSKQKSIRERRMYDPHQICVLKDYIFDPPVLPVEALKGVGFERQKEALKQSKTLVRNQNMHELCNFMGVLLLTMARPNEVKTAEFSHFDLDRLIWHKHNTKGIKLSNAEYEYRYRSIPISKKVADLVRDQFRRWPNGKYVFPSHTNPSYPRNSFRTIFKQFKKLEGVPDHFQMYDLKRIAISLMLVGQGVRREDVSHYVDHKGNLETTLIYDLGFVDPMRPVADRLGELLEV